MYYAFNVVTDMQIPVEESPKSLAGGARMIPNHCTL